MHGPSRRRFLVAGALGAVGALAGCTGYRGNDTGEASTSTGTVGSSPTGAGTGDLELPVSRSELVRGAPKDAIPAITEPTFGPDWSGVEVETRSPFGETYTATPRLDPNDRVIGVARGGEARAYPLKVLNWHEVVNDVFGPRTPDSGTEDDGAGTAPGPLLVTYCPLCGSGMTAVRTVNGQETTFGVSGFLFRNDLVMYDRLTDSLWSQIMATAINGPETGQSLTLVPSTLTTWGAWQAEHDGAVVLRPPPESNTVRGPTATRDYTIDPYAGYDSSRRIGLGGSFEDDRLHPKAVVLGVKHGGVARAYPLERVTESGPVNDTVGGLPVVVAVGPGEALVAYERTVDGTRLTFEREDRRHLSADGSRWRIATGTAVDGPHRGTTLERASDLAPMFFFAWLDFNPDTGVYGESK